MMKILAGIKKENMSQKRRVMKHPKTLKTKIAAGMKKMNTNQEPTAPETTRPGVDP